MKGRERFISATAATSRCVAPRRVDLHCLTSRAQNNRETYQGSDDIWLACLRKTFLEFNESPLLLVAHPSGQALDDWWQKGVRQVAV